MITRSHALTCETTSTWKTLNYGNKTSFAELPERLQAILRHPSPDATQARLLQAVEVSAPWRQLTLDREVFSSNAGQLLVPVRSMLHNISGSPAKEWDLEDIVLPFSTHCRTEYLTLTRLYDGHFPTRYFIGQSQETGTFYWAEQADPLAE